MEFALIIFFHVGMMGSGNANATSVVNGFSTHQLCQQAASQVGRMPVGTAKVVTTACVRVK